MIDSGIVQASLLRPGIVGVGLVSPYSRYFRTNDELSHYVMPEIALSGDYSIEFDAYSEGELRATGNSSNFASRVYVSSEGSINFRASGSNVDTGISSPDGSFPFGQFNKVVVSRVGSTASVSVNGSIVASGVAPSNAAVVNTMFNQNGMISGGILANVRMYDNGTLVRNYPINEGPGTNDVADIISGQNGTIVNGNDSDKELFNQQADGDYLGQDRITQSVWENPFIIGSQWTYESITNTWLYIGDGTLIGLQLFSTATQVPISKLSGQVERLSGTGSFAISSGNVSAYTIADSDFNSENPYSYAVTYDTSVGSNQEFKRRSGTLSVRLSKPSQRRLLQVA